MKLWGGRFREEMSGEVEEFTSSLAYDARLYRQDIAGSIAHARMLGHTGIIDANEAELLVAGLQQVLAEVATEGIRSGTGAEDIHMYVETRLTELIGPVGKKLHTGRSRNDQVALDERLYLKEIIPQLINDLEKLQLALLEQAERYRAVPLPGYTHMQHAQPVLLAHHLLAYIEMFRRDAERLCDCLKRVDIMPLGSGALAGTTFPIDREFVAHELGFAAISANSMDSVSDRDYLVELLSALSLIMVHLSRLSEEMILWSSPEFGFVEIGDAFTTGSSIMPQKKNPDVAELVRGRCGRVFGHLMSMLTVLKGLPMTYNRDLQEDKEGLFDALGTVSSSLKVYASMIRATEFKPDKMSEALKTDFSDATDVADYLVRRGMPFREAHEAVGNMVRYCLDERKVLSSLRLEEMQRFSDLFDDTIYDVLGTMNIIDARKHPGGTARASVNEALKQASERLRQ